MFRRGASHALSGLADPILAMAAHSAGGGRAGVKRAAASPTPAPAEAPGLEGARLLKKGP